METVNHHHILNTQTSTESGWDNPFRPEGDLSKEADEIVNLIRDGKPITPTGDFNHSIVNGAVERKVISETAASIPSKEIKKEQPVTQNQSAQNGKSSKVINDKTTDKTSSATTTKVSNATVPGPTSASYVVIEEKKNKKCNCCTIQ